MAFRRRRAPDASTKRRLEAQRRAFMHARQSHAWPSAADPYQPVRTPARCHVFLHDALMSGVGCVCLCVKGGGGEEEGLGGKGLMECGDQRRGISLRGGQSNKRTAAAVQQGEKEKTPKRKTGEEEAQTVLETTGNCALRAESRHRRGTKGEAGGGGSRAHIEAHKNFSRKRRQEDRNRDKGNEKKQYTKGGGARLKMTVSAQSDLGTAAPRARGGANTQKGARQGETGGGW